MAKNPSPKAESPEPKPEGTRKEDDESMKEKLAEMERKLAAAELELAEAKKKPEKLAEDEPMPDLYGVQFWLRRSRYLKEFGHETERYVAAEPSAPVVVTLPSHIFRKRKGQAGCWISHPEDPFLVRVEGQEPPPAPKFPHPKAVRTDPKHKLNVAEPVASSGGKSGRAADR